MGNPDLKFYISSEDIEKRMPLVIIIVDRLIQIHELSAGQDWISVSEFPLISDGKSKL